MTTERNPKILIVDDDPAIRHYMASILQEAGYKIIEAADGQEGIDKAVQEQPGCVLLDLSLPKVGGFVVCEMLRMIQSTESIPIIIVSGKSEEENRAIALELGATDFLSKPFLPQALLTRVQQCLGWTQKDRRREPRYRLNVPVLILFENGTQKVFKEYAFLENGSRHGARVQCHLDLPLHGLITLSQVHAGEATPEKITARVMWCALVNAEVKKYGLEFLEPTDALIRLAAQETKPD